MTGRDLLARLDRDIRAMRARLRDAVAAGDEATADETRLRAEQLDVYSQIARIRIDFLKSDTVPTALDATHREALSLLNDHDAFVAREAAAMAAAADELERLEAARTASAQAYDEATAAYDARVREIEAQNLEHPDYVRLTEAHQEAVAVASRAAQKLKLAEEDRRKKGEPYDRDPLFSYLWRRKFRTPAYRAFPLFRMLDTWVADLCDYDGAVLNYQRLTELPVRLAEHADLVGERAGEAEDALEAFEAAALAAGGATALAEAAEAKAAELAEIDEGITAAETRLHELTEAHAAALRAETGPAIRARSVIEARLVEASLPSLRVMAAETLALDDDHLVDRLVQLQADESIVEREARAATQRVAATKTDLKEVEACRSRMKSARLDSPYVTFRDGSVDDVLAQLERGGISGAEAFDRLKRLARRSGRRTSGFGGRRRTRSMGVPDILGDVMWEVAKEAMRHNNRGNWGGYRTPRRSRPTVRMPRSSGRRSGGGGFRTGGGF